MHCCRSWRVGLPLFLVVVGVCGCPRSAQQTAPLPPLAPQPTPMPDRSVWGLLLLTEGRVIWQHQSQPDRYELARVSSPDQAMASVSPDSSKVAVLDGDGTLQLIDLHTGQGQVIGGEKATKGVGGLVWAPDSKRVAYVVEGNIYTAEAGGPAKLVARGVDATTLAWSPDGQWIAFGTRDSRDRDRGLYKVSAGGGEPQQLVAPAAKDEDRIFAATAPTWSPDGRTIAFVHAWEGGTLAFVSAEGTSQRVGVDTAWFPLRWLSDSSAVVYDNTNPEGGPVGGLAQCTPEGAPTSVAPGLILGWDLGPDDRILCLRPLETDPNTQTPRRLEASVHPASGGEARRLEPTLPGSEGECAWRPDGGAVGIVVRSEELGGDLWVAEAAGPLVRLTSAPEARLAGWARAETEKLRRAEGPKPSPQKP